MRRYIQYTIFVIFVFFIFETGYPLKGYLPVNGFLRMDPLIFIETLISSKKLAGLFIPSLILLGFTLILGRFFCGYICPLGTVIDLTGPRIKKSNLISDNRRFREVKYYLLTLLIISSISGISFIYLFDPLTIITRFFSYFIYPLSISLLNLFFQLIRPVTKYLGFLGLFYKSYKEPVFKTDLVIFIIFTGIISLSFISRRFWCKNLCPLGALLGLFSSFSPFKRYVGSNCIKCGICVHSCPIDAISDDPKNSLKEECIKCLNCLDLCPEESVSFKPSFYKASKLNLSRRLFIFSALGGGLLGFFMKGDPKLHRNKGVIRPPGAIPEELFVNRCVRCALCIKVCVTNTLQPSLFEKGIQGFWTPRLYPRLAGCEQSCNLCGIVCPTKAIRELSLEEKKYAKIGTASLIRERCIVWQQDKLCFICDEACPYGAIYFKPVEGMNRPFVDPYKCNGCGICESRCPVAGESAIIVTPIGEIRLKYGSYIEEAKKQQIKLKKKSSKIPSGFIF